MSSIMSRTAAAFAQAVVLLACASQARADVAASSAKPEIQASSPFVAAALKSLSPEDRADPDREVRALRRYVYRNLPLASAEEFWITDDPVRKAPTVDAAMALFESSGRGVWCEAAAFILARTYEAAGFPAWVISFGDPKYLTHTTTVVQLGQKLYLQDSYFNFTLGNKSGTPITYVSYLTRLAKHQDVKVLQDFDERYGLFNSTEDAKRWTPDGYKDGVICRPSRRFAGAQRCKLVMSLGQFESAYLTAQTSREDIYKFLASGGWPPSFLYLMMYPLWDRRPTDPIDSPPLLSLTRRAKQTIKTAQKANLATTAVPTAH